jgi:hypothetical protein
MNGAAPEALDLLASLPQEVRTAAAGDDVGAMLGQANGNLLAKAGRGADDDGHAAGQIERATLHVSG